MANPRHARDVAYHGMRTSSGFFSSGLAGGCLGGGGRAGRQGRVDPARMYTSVQTLLRLGVDIPLADQAAESRLDMATRAGEAVVQVEMAEGGVEIVAPEQADHPAAEPDAFRIAGRAGNEARGLGDLVELLLAVLAVLGGVGRRLGFRRLTVAALRQGGLQRKQG